MKYRVARSTLLPTAMGGVYGTNSAQDGHCTTASRLHGLPKSCKSLSDASSLPPACLQHASSLPPACLQPGCTTAPRLHGWPKSCKSLSDASSLPPACPYREHRQIQGDLTFSSNIFVPITLLHQALQWRQVHVGNQTLGRSRPSSGPARNQASQESCQPGTILPIFLAGCILAGCILAGSILAGCTTAPRLHDRAEILRT